jgi:hypothetical protein
VLLADAEASSIVVAGVDGAVALLIAPSAVGVERLSAGV